MVLVTKRQFIIIADGFLFYFFQTTVFKKKIQVRNSIYSLLKFQVSKYKVGIIETASIWLVRKIALSNEYVQFI